MQIHKLSLVVLLIGAGSAQAQFGMNPMSMIAPMGMASMGGMMNPLGMMAAPLIMPMGANMLSAQRYQPQSMMNPYLNPMAASNPYLNPSAGMANPFMMMQPAASGYGGYGRPPTPGYGGYGTPPAPGYGGYGRPAAPAQASPPLFFPMMPGAAPMPAQAYGAPARAVPAPMPFFPMMPAPAAAGAAPALETIAPAAAGTPFDSATWMRMMGGGMAPAPQPPAAPAPAAPQ